MLFRFITFGFITVLFRVQRLALVLALVLFRFITFGFITVLFITFGFITVLFRVQRLALVLALVLFGFTVYGLRFRRFTVYDLLLVGSGSGSLFPWSCLVCFACFRLFCICIRHL